ncbi:cysteine hydrolase family protein [Pedobacter sp. L105]|uniref:cysteine hydrolase family protein n=1 Tax=Pedobacter sp. L105 TaxID=1641871 RepID=UPI00131C7EC6|nr:cysteine hydrolase family protein [Pedobacter sp. L105]
MSLTKEDLPALILIDIQKAFDDEEYWGGTRNNPEAEENARKLLDYWRANQLPLFHIQHISVNPDAKHGINSPGHEFKDLVKPLPGEIIIQKSVNSSFIGTNLKEQLDDKGIRNVVIAGLTTDHCVSTTTRMAGNYGYETYIVADATATFGKKGIHGEYYNGETMHLTALAQLNEEFATVVYTQALIHSMK